MFFLSYILVTLPGNTVYLNLIILCVFVCAHVHSGTGCAKASMWGSEDNTLVGLNSGHQTSIQVPLPPVPSCYPYPHWYILYLKKISFPKCGFFKFLETAISAVAMIAMSRSSNGAPPPLWGNSCLRGRPEASLATGKAAVRNCIAVAPGLRTHP